MNDGPLQVDVPTMSDADFARLSRLIRRECGINITPVKKVMLAVRLMRRIRALGLISYAQYAELLEHSPDAADEITRMIDEVSTNKTEFFRESDHFEYLSRVVVPQFEQDGDGDLLVWSAGCSTGEEAYTIAMVLSEYREARPGLVFRILATDISTRALAEAQKAVYPADSTEKIPAYLKKKYLMRGKCPMNGYYRVVPELRRLVSFRRHNLSDTGFDSIEKVGVIFCRNVAIYMDRNCREALFENFFRRMSPGGYLFVGHSETLDTVTDRFVRVAPTVYRRV